MGEDEKLKKKVNRNIWRENIGWET